METTEAMQAIRSYGNNRSQKGNQEDKQVEKQAIEKTKAIGGLCYMLCRQNEL